LPGNARPVFVVPGVRDDHTPVPADRAPEGAGPFAGCRAIHSYGCAWVPCRV